MTRINRITISGFKSFAQRTDIPFNNTYNCILGPNGSGKSNIGDAICFVLGRLSAKSMRAEKASNLVFNGGKNKKAATQGSVEIAFSNESKIFPIDVGEVVVSRTIHNDGSSVYRINDKKMTRTEVVDLMSYAKINPDGYNIILQGDITRFVEMSSVERRKIIEEISDVAIYEDKKHKAMLELEKTEQKLNDAEIILKERKTYLKELQKDRDQALKFKELKVKVDTHKATILHLQIAEREIIKAKFDEEVNVHQEKMRKAEEDMNVQREKINSGKDKIAQINHDIEQKGEKEQLKVHKEIEDLKVTIAKERTRVSTLKDEINKIGGRREKFKVELDELDEKFKSYQGNQKDLADLLKQKRVQLLEAEARIAEFKKKHKN